MNQKTTWQKIKIPTLIVLGLAVAALATWLIIMLMGGNKTTYGQEGNIDGKELSVSNVVRLPMTDPRCSDVIILFATKENYDCIIADVTITNNTNEPYEFNPLFLQTIAPGQDNAEYRLLPQYQDDDAMTAITTIEPGNSYTYQLYVVTETGRELDLSFEPEEGLRSQGREVLFDLD